MASTLVAMASNLVASSSLVTVLLHLPSEALGSRCSRSRSSPRWRRTRLVGPDEKRRRKDLVDSGGRSDGSPNSDEFLPCHFHLINIKISPVRQTVGIVGRSRYRKRIDEHIESMATEELPQLHQRYAKRTVVAKEAAGCMCPSSSCGGERPMLLPSFQALERTLRNGSIGPNL